MKLKPSCRNISLWVFLFFVLSLMGLPAISQSSAALFEKKGENWKLKLNTLYAYDDNVVTAPDKVFFRPASITKISDSMFEWSGTGTYFYKPAKKFNLRMDYDIDMTVHSKLNEFNLTSQMISLTPTYKFTPLINAQIIYSYIWNRVDGRNFSGIHFVSPNFYYMHKKFGLSRIYFTFRTTNNWKFDSRDSIHNSAGINHFFFFFNHKGRIKLAYEFTNDNTEGPAFDRNLHNLSLDWKSPLFYGIDLDAKAKFSLRNYDSRKADNLVDEREDSQQRYSVQLSKVLYKELGIFEKLTFYSKYRHIFNLSNLGIREYKSNRVDVGLKALF